MDNQPAYLQLAVDKVAEQFVDPFGDSTTRKAIHDAWKSVRHHVSKYVYVDHEWLDGEFISSLVNPEKANTLVRFDQAEFDGLNVTEKGQLTDSGALRSDGGEVTATILPIVPESHPHYEEIRQTERLFERWSRGPNGQGTLVEVR